MRLIYQHENRGLVYSVKNILTMNDIDCHIKNDFGNTMGAEFGIANTLLELWLIHDEDYEQALKIIEQQTADSQNFKPWLCKNCGEENAGQFAVCWNCQTEASE
jgi:rubrerythrin